MVAECGAVRGAMTMTAGDRLRRSTLADDAYGVVREILLEGGRYRPGEKISVEELSRELGVSRSPIWAAVARLEAEGLVTVVPRQGVFLRRFDPEAVLALYQTREALEGMAARLLAARSTPEMRARLSASVVRQWDHLSRGDVTAYHAAAQEFHQEVIQGAANPVVEKMLASIYGQARCVHLAPPLERLIENCRDHEKLVATLEDGDPDRAEIAARLHVRHLTNQIMAEVKGAGATKPQPG